MAIIICLAAIVFLVCFFTYRFLFPKVPAATESSYPNLTIEEQLANAISENESSRKETVKDYPLTVYAGDAELSALYSGVLFDGAPYGSGHYSFSGSDGD